MADIISLQELADAKLDAQSLEQFINGGVDEEVLTRLSQQYPTMQNFLLQFQKYNSRAYKTYALMDADKANIPAKMPDIPLREINRDERFMIFLISDMSSKYLLFSI